MLNFGASKTWGQGGARPPPPGSATAKSHTKQVYM